MNKNTPMCVVTVGFQRLLLPLKDGMKLLDLLQRAVGCEHAPPYDGQLSVRVEPLRLELEVISADKITFPNAPPEPRRGRAALPDRRGD